MEVVEYNGKLYLLTLIKNYEGPGSTCYDRKYQLYDYNKMLELSKLDIVSSDQLNELSSIISVSGTTKLPFIKTDKVAPISIKEIKTYKISVANAKTVTTWEFD